MVQGSWLEKYGLMKGNYRGERIPTGAGFLLLIGSAAGWSAALFWGKIRPDLFQRFLYTGIIIGAAGLIDDLAGNKESRGFRGHFKSALQGRVTTGIFKVVTALAAGLLVLPYRNSGRGLAVDLLLFLLLTNLFNLLDLRPGRALKFFLLITLPLFDALFFFLAPLYVMIALYLPYELKERVMLGDTGSNVLGALAGLGYVIILSQPLKVLLILSAAALTLFAEVNSISRLIAGNRLLTWFDRLGR